MLVGNDINEATIEMTLYGATIEVLEDAFLSITGADMNPKINNKSVPMWGTLEVKKGDILSFDLAKEGCRTYIAISGGIDVSIILNSKSTYIRGKIGGIDGRVLKEGDIITCRKNNLEYLYRLPAEFLPKYSQSKSVRVILGPQSEYFTAKGIRTFLTEAYTFTNNISRMGCRLEGPIIEHKISANIISDGTANGAIQVPQNSQPIILLNDRQTTGGYPKIACVITSDLPKVAQSKPGDKIRFKPVSIFRAHSIYRNYINTLNNIRNILNIFKE